MKDPIKSITEIRDMTRGNPSTMAGRNCAYLAICPDYISH